MQSRTSTNDGSSPRFAKEVVHESSPLCLKPRQGSRRRLNRGRAQEEPSMKRNYPHATLIVLYTMSVGAMLMLVLTILR